MAQPRTGRLNGPRSFSSGHGTYTYIILYTSYTMLKLHLISAIISRSHHICSLFVHVGVKVTEVAHDHQVCVGRDRCDEFI